MTKYKPLYALYKGLKEHGTDLPDSYGSFERSMTQAGNAGASNRRNFYQSLKDSNYDVPDTYEKFYESMFVPVNNTTSRARKIGETPMTEEDLKGFTLGAQDIRMNASKFAAGDALRYNKLKQRKQKQRKDFGRVKVGTNKTPYAPTDNVVKDEGLNTYVTSDSSDTTNLDYAQQKQAVLDEQNQAYMNAIERGDIPMASETIDKNGLYDLQENIGKDGTEVTEKGIKEQAEARLNVAYQKQKDIMAQLSAAMDGGFSTFEERMQLSATKNKIDEEVRNLEALAGKESSGFWNTLADVANTIPLLHNIKEGINYLFGDDTSKDMYKAIANSMVQSNWDFGVSDIQNSVKLEQIRDKINKGEAVTKEEKEFLDANQKADKSAEWVDQYGSRAYRWTSGAGVSAPYMIDFYITGGLPLMRGMTQAFGRGAMKIAANRGWGKLAHNIMYYTGVAAGDIIGSYAMATTVQGLKTGSDVLNRHLGTLYQDEKGNYAFGTFDENGNLLHEGGESFGKALYKGVTAAMLENYTEKMFGHWHLKSGAFDLLDKNPYTKKLADFFRGVGNKNWYLDTKKFSSKFGIGSYPEEVAEEIVNIPLNAWLVGDNSIKELGDRKTWEDIAGSMAISVGSMAGMASTPHIVRGAANQGIKAYDFAAFYVFKNRLNQANQRASEILGDEWEVIKNRIDSAPNENLGKISADLHKQVSEGKYSEEQLDAAWAYIQNLRVMRGYNLAKTMEMQAKAMTGDENTPADIRQKQLNAAYAAGQETEGENKHLAQVEYEKQKFNLASALGVSDSELENMTDEQISSNLGLDDNLDNVIYNYQNAKALYDGIMDNAQNAVDTATKVAAQRVDAMTNVEDGAIKQALVKGTMGKDDYPVYVISGNIETHDDGIINYSDSDSMIIVYNVATGRKETIPVSMLSAVNPYIQNAEEFKAQAVNEAKEKTITELSNVIDGKLVDGSQFTMEDAQGQIHDYIIEGIDEQGNCIISVDGTILPEPLSLDAIQQQYDQSNVARSVKNDQTAQEPEQTTQEPEQIQQESQPIEDKFDYAKITNENDGKVKRVDVTDEEGKNRFPNAKAVFLIQDKGAMPKFVVMDEEGNLTSYVGKRGDKIHLKGEMTIDEYKKQRQEELQKIAAENANSSMIEDNSGVDRGEIDVEDNTQPLSEADADNVIAQMESSAETAPDLELTPDNWAAEFGEDGIVSTPIGDVKMGENQVAKLFEKGRSKEFGMIKPTLTNPDVIIEVPSHSADGNEERSSSYLFIKTFLGKNGEKVYYFKSVTIKKDGLEISISSHYDRAKRVKEALMKGKLLYRKNDGAQTEQNQPSTSVTTSQEDAAGSSGSKDTNISVNDNENNESLTFEDGTPIPVDESGETDLSQTDAAHAAEWYDNNLGEDADDWLDGEIKKAKKVLEQAKNKKLAGTKPSELVASKKEKEAAIADAQAHYDSAISIRDSLKERRIAKEENTSEGRRNLIEKARRKFARLKSAVNDDAEAVSQLYRETIGSLLHRLYDGTGIDVTDTIPLTAEEYVASNLGAHSLNYEGTETSKGVKQETGLSREDFAKTQLLAADGKGTTIDALVHSLWENRPSNLESLDTQDIRNSLIGVLNSGFRASEARNFVENIRIAQAENILEEQKRAQENAAYAEQHKAEPEAELKAKLDNESSNESNDLSNETDNDLDNEKTNDNINTPEVPEDATEENPLGAQRDSAPFSPKDNTKVTNSSEERKAMVKKNAVRSEDVLDHSIGKKMRKSLSRIAKMMGADIIYLHSADSNGWYDEKTNTIYLALDSADVLGTQFVFGHEMTHEIKAKNPAAFEELKNLVKNMMGEDAFNTITDKTQQKYEKGGATYWKDRNAMEEEVVADQIGNWIHDANYAHTLMMKMSHPLLAKLHEIVNRIRFAFTGTEYSDNAKLILRSIEQSYVKTAKGEVTNSEIGEDVSFSLRDMADGKESGSADMAEDLKSLNTPDEVDDAIKTAIEDMPSGWKMANKKMIHIAQALGENRKAEIAGEEPKFSLKDGTLIKAGTYFSGGGLVEEGLKGIIDPVVAVEYDEKISGVYRNNFGQHIVTADVRDVDPKELVKQIDGEVEYFHASPVCKNYSQAKSNHAEVELDKETAASTAEFINAIKPKVVTIENVKGYKDSEAMKIITDALDANGYTWDADVYNAADYGGYTNRERLIVRAIRDGKLPEKPEKMARKSGWYEAVADIIPTLTEKKNGVAPWMDVRLKADGIDWRNIDKPLYVMGSAYADGKVPHAFADELLPTLRTKSGDVIVMPDGKVYRAMGRVLARVSGVSDDYKMPFSENLSHTIIGNGIPTQLTEHVIAPLLQNTLRPTTPDEGNTKFSLRGFTPYGKQMEEWMEKNHLEKGAVPMEKPIMKEGENIFDYANRMVEWTRNQNLWKTAPKQTGFQDALDKWKADNGLSPDAYPPVRPHRENYSTEIGYAEDLEEYNKKKELWKSAPKPKDFDLSVDLEDMNKQLRNIRRAVLNQKNYDQRTVKAVSDLVRKMLNIGWGDGLSRGKVGNLLSAAKNATGANDVKKYLDKAMGILAENYLNRLSTAYDNLINTKGARADQSGVIKMGSLDAKGQAFMSEYKKAMNMDNKSLNTYIANIEEDSAKNEDNVEMNDYRLAGIQAAIMYKQQIGGNDADIAELKRQIDELKNKKNATKEDKDLLKSLGKKLFENKFDRITMYENLLNNIQKMVKESKGRAKEFREEIAEHKNEILHRANLDLEGMDSTYYDTTTAKKKLVNNDLQRAVFSSTYTFEQFLKFFGKKAANGEGYLYNYFTKLNQDALDEEQLYNEMNRNALDEKTKELFGKEKFMKLVGIDGKGMKEMDVEVTDYSNKETGKRTIHLKQGQMLYIYLVNKETDGEMKLRAMGITEEDVAAIEENLDPRVKAMGEWLQDEYLPECQRRYQATHTKYFGAPMKEVENYFPLAINNRARNVKEDVNQDSDAMSQLAGTSTGAIVTRRVNVIPLDIENADAFEVAFNHLQEMEEWSAMLPFRQDINTLLSYTHFRNQVQNMSSVAYGSGKTLWDEFKQTAQIAAGTYKPKVNAGMMDSRIAAAMGGIAVAKISGRLWTAIKQSQSATVFLPECDFTRFVKNGVNPYGSWKWAMENIPDFRKRVENMTYGDVKLRQYLDELEKWHDWTKTISKIGMASNILVDGITCAVGARSVYETEVNRLTKLGYPKEKAEEKAYYKAVAAYNKTQQSSGGMYLSPMQVDRTYVSAALSLFKNANYAYGRMQIEACRGLARTYDLWGGKHKTTLIESMTRQIMEEDGLDENTARAIAKATYNRTFRQSIGRLINFATLVPVSWALYKVLPYLLTGDDDDKKKDMIEEAVLKGFATSLSDNYVIPFVSNILNAGLKVEDGKPTFDPEVFRYQNLYINPATSDLANIYSMIGNQKWYSVANKLGMLGVQSLIGFNPETVGALYQAVSEADYDNGNTAKEWQIGILKAISAPEESIRELYMDELGLKSGDKDAMKKLMSLAGLDADDINKVPLAELEKRYAERQINRDNLLSQIGMDAETFNGYVDKYQKSFEKKIKDKMDKWDEYDKKKADEFFDTTSDPKLKDMIEKKRAKDANAAADEQIAKEGLNQEKKGKEPSEEAYDAVKMSIDVAEDNAISTYNKVLNKRYAALNDEYNNQTDAMKYIFMSKHPNFKAYKELESEYTKYGKKIKELKEKLVSADGYDVKQTILKQIRAEREKFSELQSKVR